MAIKRQYLFGMVAIAVSAFAGVLLQHYEHVEQPNFGGAWNSPALPASTTPQTSAAHSREGAAYTVRAQTVASSAPTQQRQNESAHVVTKKPSALASPMQTPYAAAEAAPPKTPQQLIARFTVDDPSKVFLPESVRYHEAVAAEPIDQDWGPMAESQMSRFLSNQLTPNFEFMSVDCRTDLCELNLVAPSTGDAHEFAAALKLMQQQPWWTTLKFDQESGTVSFEDDRLVVVYFFSRQ
jgi:hypothetical protein